jgi:integrase
VRSAKLIKLKAGEVDRWLTAQEEQALLAKCEGKLDGDLADIVSLDLNTGLSQEEVLKRDWRQVDLFRKTLTTGRKKTEKRGLNMRTIPLDEEAYALLKRRASTGGMSGYVFQDKDGNMIKADRLKKEFRKAVRQSGIAHFRFHDCRHTFATRLAQAGVDLYTISKLLGHRSIASTQRYAHHYVESLRSGVKVLDKVEYVATRKMV